MSETLRLLEGARDGSRTSFTALFERHRGRLSAYVAARMGPALRAHLDPEDVVQETHVEAARKLADFEPVGPQAFYRWLVTIAGYKLREADRRRRAKKRGRPEALQADPQARETSVAGRASRAERVLLVARALEALPVRQAEAVRLRYLQGLSVAETALGLATSEAAVKALVARGLQALGAQLASAP